MSRLTKAGPYLVFLSAMLWATDAPIRSQLIGKFSSNFIVLIEHLIDVIIVLPVLWWARKEFALLGKKQWLAVLAIGVGGSALATIAFTQSFHYVSPSVAILLQKLQPLLVIALAVGCLKEVMSKNFWIWGVIALVSAYLISFPGLNPGPLLINGSLSPQLMGAGLAVLAAMLWGASTVLGKYVLNSVSFRAMTSLRFVIAAVFLLFLNLYEKTLPIIAEISSRDFALLAATAITSGVVSLFIYYYGLQRSKASVATLAELGFPVAAIMINWIFLKIPLNSVQLLALVILLFAVYQLGRVNANSAENNLVNN